MRIAILGPVYPFRGGIARFLERLSIELVNEGHTVKVFNFLSQYPDLIFPGKNQYDSTPKKLPFKRERILTPYNIFTWRNTYKKIAEWKPDYLIFKYWIPFFAPAFGFIIRKLPSEIKTICVIDNIDFHEKWFAADIFTKYALSRCYSLVTMSSSVHKDTKKLFPQQKIIASFHPLYDGYNKNRYTQDSAAKKLVLENKFIILFFGFIKPYKGVQQLISAFKFIEKKIPQAHLLIVGEVYGNDEVYRKQIESTGLSDDITFLNKYISDDEVEIFFKAANVLVLPYIQATQSGIMQIAYDMGVGMVVTPVGSLPDMIMTEKTGIVGSSVSPSALSDAIIRFYRTDNDVWINNIKKAKIRYSWKEFCNKLLSQPKNL